MLYLDYAKPLYNGKYILNFFADSIDDLEQLSHGKSFITKNGFNYGPCQPGSTVTITMPNSDKVVYSLDVSGKWITTETISYSEVVANPESEATEQLNKLEINGTTYNVLSEEDIRILQVLNTGIYRLGWIYYNQDNNDYTYYYWERGTTKRQEYSSIDKFMELNCDYVFYDGGFSEVCYKRTFDKTKILALKSKWHYTCFLDTSDTLCGITKFETPLLVVIDEDEWWVESVFPDNLIDEKVLMFFEWNEYDVVCTEYKNGELPRIFSVKACVNVDLKTISWIDPFDRYYEIKFTDNGVEYYQKSIAITPNVETTSETAALTSLEVAGTAYKIRDGITWAGETVYNIDTKALDSITVSSASAAISFEEYKQAIIAWSSSEIPFIRIISDDVFDVVSMKRYYVDGVEMFKAFALAPGKYDTETAIDARLVPINWVEI